MMQALASVRSLSDLGLHQQLLQLKSEESQVVAMIISHLQEVYRRRLFASYRCTSLYDYCIRILGYSNGEAHRKISACKLAAQIPEVRDSIASGEMSLSNAASVQSLVSKLHKAPLSEPCSKTKELSWAPTPELIRSIVKRVKNKSSRACEKELSKIAGELNLNNEAPKPGRRNLDEIAQLKVCVNRDKLDQLKRELGVVCEQELIEQLIAEKLNEIRETKSGALCAPITSRAHKLHAQPRSISPSKRRIVMQRAKGQCENCGSLHRLQIDHRECVATGGENDLDNLRLLCRSCNQRAAIEQLGLVKMEPYLVSADIQRRRQRNEGRLERVRRSVKE